MVRKKNLEPEVVVENLSTSPWWSETKDLISQRKIETILTIVGCLFLLVGVIGGYQLLRSFDDRFLPGTRIDNHDVTGLTQAAALAELQQSSAVPAHTLELSFDTQSLSSPSAQLQPYYDFPQAVSEAEALNQQQSEWNRVQLIMGWRTQDMSVTSSVRYSPPAVTSMLEQLVQKVNTASTEPHAVLGTSGNPASLKIVNGTFGRELNTQATLETISQTVNAQPLTTGKAVQVIPQVASTGGQLSESELTAARERATKFVGKRLTWSGSDQRLHLTDQDLIKLLTFPQGFSKNGQQDILENWRKTVERPPSNAEFEYDPGTLMVSKFVPHRDGLGLDLEKTRQQLANALHQIETAQVADTQEFSLDLRITRPEKTLADLNTLGITEIIGIGESEYDHSIPSRIHNVALTSSRITNHIVKPGEEFSFNKALGDVSAATGFQPAYVIMNGQTQLGDGGGVCQVSTTLFRALLDAGLQITRRRPHSYRVSYYELNSKPGVDATVYAGEVDLRFKNDTNHHLLIHSEADSKNLYMKVELYGTADGRTTEIVDHVTWDARPAPAPVMIPDPSLAPGKRKQIDWAASGIKARFKNVIKDKDGNVIREDTYTSNYIPWSAKYLVGP